AAVIVGLAGPVLNPADEAETGRGPLLVVLDGSWASARDWQAQADLVDGRLAEAARQGRTAAIARLTTPDAPVFRAADTWRARVPGFDPRAWEPGARDMEILAQALPETEFDTYWISDGLDRAGRFGLLNALEARGTVTIYESPRPALGLRPVVIEDGALAISAVRPLPLAAREITVQAMGRDPAGTMRVLANLPMTFDDGATEATAALSLPAELRARVTHLAIAGEDSAGATTLSDDSFRRREVALIGTRQEGETLDLLSPMHYLRKALAPSVDLLEGPLTDVLPANPDVIVLADVAALSPGEVQDLTDWAEGGGLLLRFAGPRLAASDVSREAEDPLLPVRLRAGGRNVGGAMSWGEPKTLAAFDTGSPFDGLSVPGDVTVSSQVMAQPDPSLSDRVIARLTDGTPLVTRKEIGQGQVV
ncbi:MAG: LytTR family transcriptional regulator, partial [Pseudomonadota bacterium]|nr:LytTR family transcriptional regulator [Pseudomonadota bacterium]